MRDQAELLEYDANAGRDGVGKAAEGAFLAVDRDRTGVRPEGSAQDFHESRFARAVLAEKGMDFAAANVHRNAMQDLEPHKALFDTRDLQNACHAATSTPLVRRSRTSPAPLLPVSPTT